MNNLPQAPKLSNPVMIDRVLAHIQEYLIEKIGWLNFAFGKVQKLVKLMDGKEYYYPGVYIGGNEYLNVLPGENLGNRTFFDIDDPQEIDFAQWKRSVITTKFALICWYDLRTIFPGNQERNTEEIKRQFLRALSEIVMPDGSRIVLDRFYEDANNIFKKYSLKEVDTQFLMYPYAGLRIEGNIIYREDCK